MSDLLKQHVEKIAKVDMFQKDESGNPATGLFIGRPFYLDYERAQLLVADAWKHRAHGLPKGALLLAYYANEEGLNEAVLLRVLQPAKLPTDNDVISSMVEYYKDNLRTAGKDSQLDSFTKYEFSFSGVECRVLGTFYQYPSGGTTFGADLENFYSAHNYQVIKPSEEVLEVIVNLREDDITGTPKDIKIGNVRYSSSVRMSGTEASVPVYVTPADFLGKRTALFGMTRTGKSNTVKKIIQATVEMSKQAPNDAADLDSVSEDKVAPMTEEGVPTFPCGQIIFDINGEYANPNLQDEGTAIYEQYEKSTDRYSVVEKDGFKVMKVNFYEDPLSGFEFVRELLQQHTGDYVQSVAAIDLEKPSDYASEKGVATRYDRKLAAYLCCLHRAGFVAPSGFQLKFEGNAELNELARPEKPINPKNGISLDEATQWFSSVWENYDSAKCTTEYKKNKGREWADEDLRALLVFLTRARGPGKQPTLSGYQKLRELLPLHTSTIDEAFEDAILRQLRRGEIVIVDLSQGSEQIQRTYTDRLCRRIFVDAMNRFIERKANNFIQFYFEEAHNLFPKKDDRDLSGIYQRLAKEGAKLHIGLIYATQEVSSIASNILKNTQNWFISHLNNDDETKELRKFYDFSDFTEQLVRFSAITDKGFVRMKTYSNPFVVPVQVDRFSAK